jgi:hypothetical protein
MKTPTFAERSASRDNVCGQAHEVGAAENTQDRFSYPRPDSVKGRVLADLLDGQRITHMTVWARYASSRAAHHVLRLRQAGFPVETRDIIVPTRDGRNACIAEYSLPRLAIEQAGERRRRFVEAARAEG